MKKKIIIITAFLVVILAIGFIIYQAYLQKKYQSSLIEHFEVNNLTIAKSKKTITELQTASYNNLDNLYFKLPDKQFYYTFDSIEGIKDIKQQSIINMSLIENNYFKANIEIKKYEGFYTNLNNNNVKNYTFMAKIDSSKVKEILKRNNITSDYQLYSYALNNYDKKLSLLSLPKDVLLKYIAINVINTEFKVKSITIIDGRYDGLMFENSNNIVVLINDGNQMYSCTFENKGDYNYFNTNNVKEYLNSIYIATKEA